MATPYMTAAVLLRWVRSSLHSTISCFSSGRSIFISITLIRAPCFGLMATIEKLLLPWRELGIGIVAHGPLGRGFFTHGYDDEGNARCKSHDRRYRGSVEEDSVLS